MKRGKNKFFRAKGRSFINGTSFCFLVFLLSACYQNSIYEKNISINDQLWFHRQIPEFKVHSVDTNENFDIFINLRHSSTYKYSNLSLIIDKIDPLNQETTYRIKLQLAEPDGRWKGVGTGNILSYQVPFLKDSHFSDTGIYTFKIKQNMNINPLPGVLDVGIQLLNKN